MIHIMDDPKEVPAYQAVRPGLRLPMQARPIDRTATATALHTDAGAAASLFGFDPCDLLPSPAKEICKGILH